MLRRELEALKKQARELLSEKSPERDTEHILAENNKLQVIICVLLEENFIWKNRCRFWIDAESRNDMLESRR